MEKKLIDENIYFKSLKSYEILKKNETIKYVEKLTGKEFQEKIDFKNVLMHLLNKVLRKQNRKNSYVMNFMYPNCKRRGIPEDKRVIYEEILYITLNLQTNFLAELAGDDSIGEIGEKIQLIYENNNKSL